MLSAGEMQEEENPAAGVWGWEMLWISAPPELLEEDGAWEDAVTMETLNFPDITD